MRAAIGFFGAAMFISVPLSANALPPESAKIGGVTMEKARVIFADIPADGPGCSAAVFKSGKVLWAEGFGLADVDSGRKNDAETVYNIASVSKQFTGFAVLLLESQRKLSLDDSIRRYLPELGAFAEAVTIRHLLHHTGGLRDYLFIAETDGVSTSDRLSEKDGLAMIFRQSAPDFAAGTENAYSNTGYFLLSEIVQRVSRQTMAAFAKANIFSPLGMASASYVDHYPANISTLARGYAKVEDGKYTIDESMWEMTGDGQVHVNVKDMAKWERNLVDMTVGGREVVTKLVTSGELNGKPLNYGAGISLGEYRGVSIVEHAGGWAGYSSHFVALPSLDIGAAVFCNTNGLAPRRRARELIDLFAGDKLSESSGDDPAAELRGFIAKNSGDLQAGTYISEAGNVVTITAAGRKLTATLSEGTQELRKIEPGLYRSTGEDEFIVAIQGHDTIRLSWDDKPLRRVPDAPLPANFATFAGSYASPDIGAPLIVTVKDGGLVASLRDHKMPMHSMGASQFWTDRGVITFNGDEAIFVSPLVRRLVLRRN